MNDSAELSVCQVCTTSQKNDKKNKQKNKSKLNKKQTNKPASRQTRKYRELSGEKRERNSLISGIFLQLVCTPILRLHLKKVRVQFQRGFERVLV